jgi:hypothetical protein
VQKWAPALYSRFPARKREATKEGGSANKKRARQAKVQRFEAKKARIRTFSHFAT